MFTLYSFGSVLRTFGRQNLYFLYFLWTRAAALHTGINYYYFNEGINNTLVDNGFSKIEILQLLNEGKINTQWQELLTVTEFSKILLAI
jgi:hypothetical protein